MNVTGAQIAALAVALALGDRVIDLQGDRVLPAMVNAPEHLQLNSLRRHGCAR